MVEALQPESILQIGSSLQYRIESILGRGGFGLTYLATDLNLDMQVAIKEYLPSEFAERTSHSQVAPKTGDDGELYQWGLDRFIEEARILARFKHPNIVRVLNVFKKNNTAYMIMEYEEGSNLQELLKVPSYRTEERLTSLFDAILNGLEQVHEHNIVHRDIKPANIYIRSDNTPVLLDFGSARIHLSDKSQVMTRILTKGYAPYEQEVEGAGRQGPWTDIYSIGVTLYFAISQQLPTNSISRFTRVIQSQSDPLTPASELSCAPQYSHGFLYAIEQALQVKPEDRPQTAAAFRRLLNSQDQVPSPPEPISADLSQDKTVLATGNFYENSSQRSQQSSQVQNRNEKPEPRNREQPSKRPIALVAALIVILAIAGGGSFWFLSNEQQADSSSLSALQETPSVVNDKQAPVKTNESVLDVERQRLRELERIEEANKKQLAISQQEFEAFEAEENKRVAEAEKAAETLRLAKAEKAAENLRLAEAEKAAETQRRAEAEKAAETQQRAEAEKATALRLAKAQKLADAEKAEARIRKQKAQDKKKSVNAGLSNQEKSLQKTENDMQTISRLFNNFRLQLKTCEMKALTQMSIGHKDNVAFVNQLCQQYSSMTLGIKDLRGNSVQGTASATIEIKSLLNKNGDHIFPSKSWNTLPLKTNKSNDYWGKVEW